MTETYIQKMALETIMEQQAETKVNADYAKRVANTYEQCT